MRKDIKKRLEKALITLEEPGGSTIRSIIKIINKEAPALSVRKVLEALQDGLNEGFLCMYNGRFKLKQQVQSQVGEGREQDYRKEDVGQRRTVVKMKTPAPEHPDEASDYLSEEDGDFDDDMYESVPSRRDVSKRVPEVYTSRKSQVAKKLHSGKRKQSRYATREENLRRKRGQLRKKHTRGGKESGRVADSMLEMADEPEKSRRPTAERPDMKKQRGPRCTSMKKDVRMPSKVQIPFVPTSIPQTSNTFNDLLRRSPEPVNGPLFDCISLTADNLGFFGTCY